MIEDIGLINVEKKEDLEYFVSKTREDILNLQNSIDELKVALEEIKATILELSR